MDDDREYDWDEQDPYAVPPVDETEFERRWS